MASAPCRKCGTEPRVGARFCDSCGTPIDTDRQLAEYKQVTVLFADVTHSMEIASAVGPERLREIMSELFNRSTSVVERFGGTVDKFIGDGIMALFGAPAALEDHALRACLAALSIQQETQQLAAEVAGRDDIALQVRVGLNSGEVIAGEIGSSPANYTVIGAQVGMAQRMESVAPPGGVMLSESTARLVDGFAQLSEPEMVRIKGSAHPVPARRLLAVAGHRDRRGRRNSKLVGREREMSMLTSMLDAAISKCGRAVGLEGSPGIGKSRIVREIVDIARSRGFAVFSTFCESHSSAIPFSAVSMQLRSFFGVDGLAPDAARSRVHTRFADTNQEDLSLLDGLLGIDVANACPLDIDPDARQRRLTRLLGSALLAHDMPTVYIVEDAHWIDSVSESMLAEFASLAVRTRALMMTTFRPEYQGALRALSDPVISLAPLADSQAASLIAELLGSDETVADLAPRIAEQAAGNPFFTEEIVRDLVERGVLDGERGGYVCRADAVEVIVPATVQATIAARIDRLGHSAKRTLNAASVIGSRFSGELLDSVLDRVDVGDLIAAELIYRVPGTPRADYEFAHPLICEVAYESQLKSGRTQLHLLIATAIESREPGSVDENAALIATHLAAAGESRRAFDWYMRAGGWSSTRNIAAARTNWGRARRVADRLPPDDRETIALRTAPRTLLCATTWRVGGSIADTDFDKLRELTSAGGDKKSLVIGMFGAADHALVSRKIPGSICVGFSVR